MRDLLFFLAALTACAHELPRRAPARPGWLSATTDHFVVEGELTPGDAARFASELEAIRGAMPLATTRSAPAGGRVTVVFFSPPLAVTAGEHWTIAIGNNYTYPSIAIGPDTYAGGAASEANSDLLFRTFVQ